MKENVTGERIAKRRKELHLSQTQLAEMTGYSDKTAISKIENGQSNLTQTKLVIFADALQTTTMYLMGWIDDPNISREQIIAQQQVERMKVYSANLQRLISIAANDIAAQMPEELVVAEAYRHAPQHIKDAIKAMLQIERKDE